jgi:serine/threonine protein kinase
MSTGQDNPVGVGPGEVLAGKYRVERVLGQGGMGIVVAAHHLQLDEKVALKFLLPEALGNPEAVARFVREARAAVKIKSEHVARVSDVGQLENGAPYMVMEFLQGGDLAAWLKQNGALPFEQAVDFVLQASVAVADAHALGIVHRDLKPANLFCVRRSDGQLTIKVLDFGISKTTNLGASGPGMDMTKTSALMGTPLYMSPEQMRSSRDVDGTTDIWALGVILFELMAGRTPFFADSVTELVMKVASDPPPPLCTFRPEAPAGLDAVIAKCLEKDRGKRYRNIGELALALLPFAPKRAKASVDRISGILQSAGLGLSDALAVPVSPPANGTQASAGTLPPVGRTTFGATRAGSKTLGFVAAGVVAMASAVAGVVLLRGHAKDPRETAQPASSPISPESASPPPAALSSPPSTASEAATAPASNASTPSLLPTSSPAPARSIKVVTAGPLAVVPPKPAASTPSAAATAPAKPVCTAASFLGADGETHWKQVCH